jgi:glycosyltransferase involved in cell wall biosynthesis
MAPSATPILSVITPVFNGEAFIAACLKSVAAQDCPFVEHIVVDGNSQDRTMDIVRDYARSRQYIRWISEPDSGQSEALNKGIRAARADYISILNVDDFYASGTLNRVVAIIQTLREPRFICGNCNVLTEGDRILYVNRPATLKIENILADWATWPYPYNPSSYFYPKAVHDLVGYYDVEEHHCMDVKFVLAAIQKLEPLYLDEVLGNFRFIPGTKTYQSWVTDLGRRTLSRVLREAFTDTPLSTKLRVVDLKVRLAYWSARRTVRRLTGRIQV